MTDTILIERLRDAALCRRAVDSSLVQKIASGQASLPVIQHYLANVWSIANNFSSRMAKVWAACDDSEIRASLLENVLEEEGVISFQANQLKIDPTRNHGALAGRLAAALGVYEKPAPQPQAWLDQALAEGRWREAYAFMAVGHEFNVPETVLKLYQGFREHYGLTHEQAEFLWLHGEADCRHGEAAITLLAQSCENDEHRAQAISGARRGAINFYLLHQVS